MLFDAFFGYVIGMVVGLIPSFHINNWAAIVLAYYFSEGNDAYYLLLFSSASFTLFSFISVMFYKTPTENELYVPSMMRYLNKRGALNFIYLVFLGSMYSTLFLILFIFVFLYLTPLLYTFVFPYIKYLLLASTITYFVIHRSWKYFLIGSLSALIGYFVMFHSFMNENYALSPMFIGFYGMPYLLIALFNGIAPHTKHEFNHQSDLILNVNVSKKVSLASSLIGTLSSYLALLLPTIPPIFILSSILSFVSLPLAGIVIAMSSMAFSDNILSIFASLVIGNSRNGVGVALSNMKEISFNDVVVLLAFSSIIIPISYYFAYKIISFNAVYKILNSNHTRFFVIVFIVFFVSITTNMVGLAVLVLSTLVGYISLKMNLTPTVHLFSLIIPLLLSFYGITI